ncbi:hypothetical protein [Methanocalculus taiwanensis]|nr:hypothetical protein [Methanocalculus taiwanensis]
MPIRNMEKNRCLDSCVDIFILNCTKGRVNAGEPLPASGIPRTEPPRNA